MDENKNWCINAPYQDLKKLIEANLTSMKRKFVAIGYYLKQIRDRELYVEDGYKNIWEFAEDTYGIKRSTCSRWMQINDMFSKNGNTPYIADEFKEYSKSQLQEMLYLEDGQLGQVTPDMTVKEIREMRKPEEDHKENNDIPG